MANTAGCVPTCPVASITQDSGSRFPVREHHLLVPGRDDLGDEKSDKGEAARGRLLFSFCLGRRKAQANCTGPARRAGGANRWRQRLPSEAVWSPKLDLVDAAGCAVLFRSQLAYGGWSPLPSESPCSVPDPRLPGRKCCHAGVVRVALTDLAGASILRAAPDWVTIRHRWLPAVPDSNTGVASRVPRLTRSTGTSRSEQSLGTSGTGGRGRHDRITLVGPSLFPSFIDGELLLSPCLTRKTSRVNSRCNAFQPSVDHRYSPYRTCLSCDRTSGGFVVKRGRSHPMLVVLSHSRSRA
jgi:hypothetical protein